MEIEIEVLNLYISSEFETMINPQFKPADPKKSMKSIKKFLPQLSSMAKGRV